MLGVGFGVAVAVGNTIGAGILRAPGEIAEQLPHPGLFLAVWVIGALYALLGAVQIAELGAMLPRSGGQYVFARHALGDYAGFLAGWSDWLGTCGSCAAVCIVAAEFSSVLFASLSDSTAALAVTVAVAFALLQWRGIRWGSTVQNVTSAIKAIAFAALAVMALLIGSRTADAAAVSQSVPTGFALLTAFVASLQAVIFTYDGWTGPVYFSEEIDDPGRNVPRALFGSVLTVGAIYLLMNVSLLYVMPISAIAGRPLAAGALAEAVFGRYGNTVFTGAVILSMLSGINAYHLMASRVLYAMSRDGLFWSKAAQVNPGGTPSVALFFSAAAAVLFIAFGRTFSVVITVLTFFFVANYALSFIAVFVLRRREPDAPRPYRAWGYPWSTVLALAGSVAFLVGAVASDLRHSVFALLLLAASYPVFRVVKS